MQRFYSLGQMGFLEDWVYWELGRKVIKLMEFVFYFIFDLLLLVYEFDFDFNYVQSKIIVNF